MTHPYEEMRAMKKLKAHYNMLGFVVDAKYGIPSSCPCGGSFINEVSLNPKYHNDVDTLPGSKYFTCKNFEDDGLHFRQPWVIRVEEEVQKLMRRVDEMDVEIAELKCKLFKLSPR